MQATTHFIQRQGNFFCNFDKDLPIPEKLKDICGELSTSYNKKANLEEKIDFLKRNGKRFTIHQLHNMMSIINKENMVQIHSRDVFHQVDAFKDFIETLELNNSELFNRSKLIPDSNFIQPLGSYTFLYFQNVIMSQDYSETS